MNATSSPDYSVLDHPEISNAVFHPRAEWGFRPGQSDEKDHLIAVAPDIHIGARFHTISPSAPNILFFHGNGEIVADYDDLGPVYNQMGINLLVTDYRGYGRSNGAPSASAMMADCHTIYEYARQWLRSNGFNGPVMVMGRSLGSASALELAATYAETIDALIIESGFAYAEPLLRLLGVDVRRIGFREENGFRNVDKINRFPGPTLIIHAEHDHIIPFSDGRALYQASNAHHKQLVQIDGANHNDIFAKGLKVYMQAVAELVGLVTAK